MSYHIPDRELFEGRVLIKYEYNKELRCDLQGLCHIREDIVFDGDLFDIPCIYKKILSHKNGFTRAINIAGNLVYIADNGYRIFDRELPFIPELCEDFDETGIAKIACLIEGVYIVKGYMNNDGEMFLKSYNS